MVNNIIKINRINTNIKTKKLLLNKENNITNKNNNVNLNSNIIKLINCAVVLSEPRKAYLELADQPASNIPYAESEETASIYKIPKLKFHMANPGL